MAEKTSLKVSYRQRFLLWDFLASLMVTAIAALLYTIPIWPISLDLTPEAQRALYTTTAAITGSLLGFVIAAVTIALALPETPSTNLLRTSRRYKEVYDTFLSTLRCLGFTTVVSVIPLVVRVEAVVGTILGLVFVWLIILSSFRIARSVWILGQLVAVVTSPASSSAETKRET